MSPRRLSLLILIGVLAMFGLSSLALPPAYADTCAPDPATACIQGIIKTSAGDPAAGVTIDLDEGAQQTETDDAGRWSFAVDADGEYTVALDTATLPSGEFAKGQAERTVNVKLYNSVSALFPLTDDEAAAAAPGAAGTSGASGTDAPAGQAPASTNQSGAAPGAATATEASGDGFSWPRLWQQAASGVRMGLLLSLAAVGLSLVFGTTGFSNFAHAEMLSMGGILAFLFMSLTGNIWLAGGISVVLMAAFGWVQDAALWKPLRKKRLSLMQLMIVSIGLSIVLQNVFQFFFGANVLRIDPSTPKTITMLGVTLTVQSYVAMAIALVAIVGVGVALKFTRFGRATRAVSDNPALAEASGIDVNRVIRVVWIASAALAGLAGVLLGLVLNGISWNTGWHFLLLLFAAVVLGGIGTAFGAVIGAMIIGMIVEMANIWLPGDLKHAAALFILIVVLLIRPQGIFGRKERIG
ncbi:branched-chain amino acid transport system permease protein [Leucobacter exalbidus]|uniref:Branched-chain amino acid transport system permease protein n=1 Tax=Leucobacter exalbidus TaxID=662960 RepID=A0A940PP43_9MICO|nr:branched-chain amino acid transport system permease protein [Leucobacter exalbidus]